MPAVSEGLLVAGVDVLCDAGWSVDNAVLLLDSVADMTLDSILQIERLERSRADSNDPAGPDALTPDQAPTASHRRVRAYIGEVLAGDPERWWSRKLDLLLAGGRRLEADAAESR